MCIVIISFPVCNVMNFEILKILKFYQVVSLHGQKSQDKKDIKNEKS